jgi:DNA-binding IclR family transcriptional regulator
MEKNATDGLKSVEKALRIIESFDLDRPEISVSEFVESLSIPKVSVYRFLRVLTKNGFISHNKQTKKYRLGLKIFELGSIVLKNFDFREVAFPIITELSNRSGETVHLGVLDNQQVVSIESVESNQTLRISMPVGKRVYLHSTGVGKAILASLNDEEIKEVVRQKGLPRFTNNTIVVADQLLKEIQAIRARGYAIDNEENEPGVRCIAAPVVDPNQRFIASISVSGPSVRVSRKRIPELSHMAIEASRKITEALKLTTK